MLTAMIDFRVELDWIQDWLLVDVLLRLRREEGSGAEFHQICFQRFLTTFLTCQSTHSKVHPSRQK